MILFKAASETTLERRARVEAGIYALAPDLTPVDAVRIARCLLENVCDHDVWDDFNPGDERVKHDINDACDYIDQLRLEYP